MNNRIHNLVEDIIANYRDGLGAHGMFKLLDQLSVEWETQGLPCVVPNHGRRDRIAEMKASGELRPLRRAILA